MKNEEKIITLSGENNKSIDFFLDAEIEYNDETYVVLRPVKDDLELSKDEALVFRVDYIDNDDFFEMVEDDETLEAITKIYNEEN